jgi:hypothetical protein
VNLLETRRHEVLHGRGSARRTQNLVLEADLYKSRGGTLGNHKHASFFITDEHQMRAAGAGDEHERRTLTGNGA